MRTLALTKRILSQTLHDIRTLLLILFAPLVVLTMIYFILNAEDHHYTISIISENEDFREKLTNDTENDITVTHVTEQEARQQIKDQELDGAVDLDEDGNATILINGTDVSVASKVEMLIRSANAAILQDHLNETFETINIPGLSVTEPEYDVEYVTGTSEGNLFDKFGTQLIGIIVFFFVFLIAGINFLNERTQGTMEKLLSTPIRRYEIVCGYILGFGTMAILQSTLITMYAVYVLGLHVQGNILLVLLVTLLTAINALCFGILLSTVAHSEFQMVQFIPIVILPQIFLAGLFRMSGIWEKIGYLVPLHYTSHALTNIIMIGNGISAIRTDLLVLSGLSAVFIWINILLLKRQRSI